MPTSYKLEGLPRPKISPNNRAGCQNPECSNNNVKLKKGEVRFGTWVEIPFQGQVRGSWKWRHWGCVTPAVVSNLKQICEDRTDLIEGFDEISAEYQQRVVRALYQGHIDDEDWNGDEELNRPGKKGFRNTPIKKKSKPNSNTASGIPIGAEDCLEGLNFVFTGHLVSISREDGEALAQQYGARITKQPSSKTHYVILGSEPNGKIIELVEKHSIQILDESAFFDLIRTSPFGGRELGSVAPKKRKISKKEEDSDDGLVFNVPKTPELVKNAKSRVKSKTKEAHDRVEVPGNTARKIKIKHEDDSETQLNSASNANTQVGRRAKKADPTQVNGSHPPNGGQSSETKLETSEDIEGAGKTRAKKIADKRDDKDERSRRGRPRKEGEQQVASSLNNAGKDNISREAEAPSVANTAKKRARRK